eukprot:c39953_g1_i1 orf=157-393(-)
MKYLGLWTQLILIGSDVEDVKIPQVLREDKAEHHQIAYAPIQHLMEKLHMHLFSIRSAAIYDFALSLTVFEISWTADS